MVHLRITKVPYYPAIDWLHKLDSMSVKAVLEQTTVSDRCGEVTTPLEWLWLGKSITNEQLCKQLGQELVRLDKACPAVKRRLP